MKTFKLKISSPDGDIFNGDAVRITLRGTEGVFAIMAGHIPFATTIVPCECKIEFEDDSAKFGKIDGGLLSVSTETVILLSGSFEWKNQVSL